MEHVDSLYRVALRMTRNTEDAEDLVQDTYLKAVRSAHLYKQGGKCKAWLMRILVNSHIDRYRRLKREPREVEFAEDAGGEVYRELYSGREGSGDPFGPAADSDLNSLLSSSISDEVKGALDGLPEAFRSVVLLRYVEDLSYQEIAGIVGIPLGTVMSRLFRGRRLLGKQLWNYARAQGYIPRGMD